MLMISSIEKWSWANMKKLLRYCLTVVILAALIWGGIWGYRRWFGQKTKTVFKTEAVEKAIWPVRSVRLEPLSRKSL